MKIYFVSLGCDKNSVDSEVMLGALNDAGFVFTDDVNEAQACVVNTCCFINDAKKESIDTLIELGERRKKGQLKALIACGCLAQRYTDEIHEMIPEVDALVGIASIEHIAEALNDVLKNTPRDYIDSTDTKIHGNHHRIVTTGGYFDYLKIAEGCNKRCTYCVIPYVRGNYRSIPMEELVSEAKTLVECGVRELNLVAQETSVYGIDLYGQKSLHTLIHKLCEIEDLKWIRVLYCYPEEITDELIDCIATEPKVVHYLDMPIQSGSDEILKKMGRRTTRGEIYELVAKLRQRIPDICLRTTLISGFPGETRKNHQETLTMVRELEFDRLGAFTYSREEGTVAASMKGQVFECVKKKRFKEIMSYQQPIAFKKTESMVGRRLLCMVEGSIPEERIYVARTYRDAPDVDGYLFVNSDRELMSGDMILVDVTDTNEYDLIGEFYEFA